MARYTLIYYGNSGDPIGLSIYIYGEYGGQAIQSEKSKCLDRKSDGCIVPMILGNSNGGKAATLLLPFMGTHFLHTEVGN